MYNAIARQVERELFPALKRHGIRFLCYNPLAAGLLTGKHDFSKEPSAKFSGELLDGLWLNWAALQSFRTLSGKVLEDLQKDNFTDAVNANLIVNRAELEDLLRFITQTLPAIKKYLKLLYNFSKHLFQ